MQGRHKKAKFFPVFMLSRHVFCLLTQSQVQAATAPGVVWRTSCNLHTNAGTNFSDEQHSAVCTHPKREKKVWIYVFWGSCKFLRSSVHELDTFFIPTRLTWKNWVLDLGRYLLGFCFWLHGKNIVGEVGVGAPTENEEMEKKNITKRSRIGSGGMRRKPKLFLGTGCTEGGCWSKFYLHEKRWCASKQGEFALEGVGVRQFLRWI